EPGSKVTWALGVVEATKEDVDRALQGHPRAYRLIVNTPTECVIGGEAQAVAEVADTLGAAYHPLPGVTTVHCEVARAVEGEYRALHRLPTTPPSGVRFYSGARGHAYPLDTDTAADVVTEQAIVGIDYPKVVRQAYEDGVRIFVELGPGGSCTRMIDRILAGRPYAARTLSEPGRDGAPSLLRMLGMLLAHRVPVDLSPLYDLPAHAPDGSPRTLAVAVGRAPVGELPPVPRTPKPEPRPAAPAVPMAPAPAPQGPIVGAAAATASAHAAFLDASASMMQVATAQLQVQLELLRRCTVPHDLAPPTALDREQCLQFARGRIGDVLGPRFAAADQHPTRVRLPDEPLMLVDRILHVDAEPGSMTHGRVVTEHDVLADAWYLDAGRIPTCVAVEAGQADLFLSAYLGIDAQTRGLAVYRLLDATVTFHGPLPRAGSTIHYDIAIERFFQQGQTWLFRFRFDATVDGMPLMTMRDGCAGFFSEAELAAGRGVVDARLAHAKARPSSDLAERPTFVTPRSHRLDSAELDALRAGDLALALGDEVAALRVDKPVTIPGAQMRLVHRITELSPDGGEFGLGFVQGEADIHPDDWFITCHFVDDPVMPGTLMYECCMHTLRVFLLSLGWVGEEGEVAFEPKPGVQSRLKCRGQVLEATKVVRYEVTMRQFGSDPEPWVICDARMYADGKRIVDIEDMSARLTGTTAAALAARAGASRRTYDKASLEAFAYGKPSDAFGAPYEVFDGETRAIARLPGAPFQFIDRVPEVHGPTFVMKAGARCRAEVDQQTWAWTLDANRQRAMPFSVLLEIGLQACGWLAAYCGSALTTEDNVHFRNLGGKATLHRAIDDDDAMLQMHAKLTSVSASGGMIIQQFEFGVYAADDAPIYVGTTDFGFFSGPALAQQIGIRDAPLVTLSPEAWQTARSFSVPRGAPMPDDRFRMVDRVDALIRDGGPEGLGFISGSIDVDADAWFFKAHFHGDPVWPGSLGLEAFLQLLKVFALDRWDVGADAVFSTFVVGHAHEWVYRGQVIPSCGRVEVQASIISVSDADHRVVADGFLVVDGRPIYQMKRFALELSR
ncbi:MAG: type I polyketide synthase, partial [Myxococcota bacterium]